MGGITAEGNEGGERGEPRGVAALLMEPIERVGDRAPTVSLAHARASSTYLAPTLVGCPPVLGATSAGV